MLYLKGKCILACSQVECVGYSKDVKCNNLRIPVGRCINLATGIYVNFLLGWWPKLSQSYVRLVKVEAWSLWWNICTDGSKSSFKFKWEYIKKASCMFRDSLNQIWLNLSYLQRTWFFCRGPVGPWHYCLLGQAPKGLGLFQVCPLRGQCSCLPFSSGCCHPYVCPPFLPVIWGAWEISGALVVSLLVLDLVGWVRGATIYCSLFIFSLFIRYFLPLSPFSSYDSFLLTLLSVSVSIVYDFTKFFLLKLHIHVLSRTLWLYS